jgi:hypothetical protein
MRTSTFKIKFDAWYVFNSITLSYLAWLVISCVIGVEINRGHQPIKILIKNTDSSKKNLCWAEPIKDTVFAITAAHCLEGRLAESKYTHLKIEDSLFTKADISESVAVIGPIRGIQPVAAYYKTDRSNNEDVALLVFDEKFISGSTLEPSTAFTPVFFISTNRSGRFQFSVDSVSWHISVPLNKIIERIKGVASASTLTLAYAPCQGDSGVGAFSLTGTLVGVLSKSSASFNENTQSCESGIFSSVSIAQNFDSLHLVIKSLSNQR